MQRACSLMKRSGAMFVPRRYGSGGMEMNCARWSERVREMSNIETVDDPPTAPLPEEHDLGDGFSDFSNFIDKYEEVSMRQAGVSLVLALGGLYGVYRLAKSANNEPYFVPRTMPYIDQDLPRPYSELKLAKEKAQ